MSGTQKTLVVSFLFVLHVIAQVIDCIKFNRPFDLGEYRLFVIGVIIYFLGDHGVNSKYNSEEGKYPVFKSGSSNINKPKEGGM